MYPKNYKPSGTNQAETHTVAQHLNPQTGCGDDMATCPSTFLSASEHRVSNYLTGVFSTLESSVDNFLYDVGQVKTRAGGRNWRVYYSWSSTNTVKVESIGSELTLFFKTTEIVSDTWPDHVPLSDLVTGRSLHTNIVRVLSQTLRPERRSYSGVFHLSVSVPSLDTVKTILYGIPNAWRFSLKWVELQVQRECPTGPYDFLSRLYFAPEQTKAGKTISSWAFRMYMDPDKGFIKESAAAKRFLGLQQSTA